MLREKRNWILAILFVLCMGAIANAALPEGENIFGISGDMETGGSATTLPDFWETNLTVGTVGVSSDTPRGSAQSLKVAAGDSSFPYALAYGDQSGYVEGTQLFLSYDIKGDWWAALACQNGVFDTGSAYGPSTSYETYNRPLSAPDEWVHIEDTATVGAGGVNGFSFYLYDYAAPAGAGSLLDNLVLSVYTPPTPGPVSWFPNGDMEPGGYEYGGTPISSPGVWSGTDGTTSSRDVPVVAGGTVPGGGSQSLSITADAEYSDYAVGYSYDGDAFADPPVPLTVKLATPDTAYELSFWHKGDVRVAMSASTEFYAQHFTGSPDEWVEETVTVTTDEFTSGQLSLYFYDLVWDDGGIPLLIDNVWFGEAAALLEGDANRDGIVSAGDYTSVQNNFGNTGAADGTLPGDANMDGVVSAGDYTSVQNNFGNHLPEPTTICMMGIALVALIRRRRK